MRGVLNVLIWCGYAVWAIFILAFFIMSLMMATALPKSTDTNDLIVFLGYFSLFLIAGIVFYITAKRKQLPYKFIEDLKKIMPN